MTSELVYRKLLAADAPSLILFREKIATESTHTMQYIGMKNKTIEETEFGLISQNEGKNLFIGVFDGSLLVGALNFRMTYPDHPWFTHVGAFGMMLIKDYWGRGLGRVLLEHLDQHAKQHKISRIEAMVRVNNERGVKLYKRAGFTIEGTKKMAAFIDGEFCDEHYLAKILKSLD